MNITGHNFKKLLNIRRKFNVEHSGDKTAEYYHIIAVLWCDLVISFINITEDIVYSESGQIAHILYCGVDAHRNTCILMGIQHMIQVDYHNLYLHGNF